MRTKKGIWSILLFAALFFAQGAWAQEEFVEGVDYQLLNPPMRTDNPAKVEVAEYFWYGCPHCFHMEPLMRKWEATMPATAEFVRVPADFDGRWGLMARAYYTAQILGVLDKVHEPLFNAIHVKKEQFTSEEQLADFFKEFGVSADDFAKAFHSFAVESKYRRAVSLTRKSGIDGVPAIIVNGKYRTSATITGSTDRMFQVVNYLIAKEAAAIPAQ